MITEEMRAQVREYQERYLTPNPWIRKGAYIRRKDNGDWGQIESVSTFSLRIKYDEDFFTSKSSLAAFMGGAESIPIAMAAILFEPIEKDWMKARPARAVENPPV